MPKETATRDGLATPTPNTCPVCWGAVRRAEVIWWPNEDGDGVIVLFPTHPACYGRILPIAKGLH